MPRRDSNRGPRGGRREKTTPTQPPLNGLLHAQYFLLTKQLEGRMDKNGKLEEVYSYIDYHAFTELEFYTGP